MSKVALAAAALSITMLLSVAARRLLSSSQSGQTVTVLVSVPSAAVGSRIAKALVQDELAACVQIVGGVTSVYRWKGNIEEDAENLLLIKTRNDLFSELTAKVTELHPYETPEIIALPIVSGNARYLQWIIDSTKHKHT